MGYAEALSVEEFGARAASVAPGDFREAMRELASGVALVTSASERARAGCAVSSFASLSLSPASLVVCLNADSSTLACIRGSGAFAVNILSSGQEALARRFASPLVRGAERFAEGEWGELATGAPILGDALAVVDCRLARIVEHATHALVIGEAIAVVKGTAAAALVHWRSHFEALA
ncbi:MAG: flavin reductase family protein [Pseudomonadota bacterium]|nr:flavin reductase family protein [Pseudomonadota bacterium]